MECRESDDQRDAERERPERAQRLAGRPPAAPGREQEPEPRGQPAVVARLLDEEGGSGEEAGGEHHAQPAAHLPARGQRERHERRQRRHQLAVGREALDHRRGREQAAEQCGRRARAATGHLRHQQTEHDGDGARPQRRHQADVEPVRPRQGLGPAVEQQEPLRPVDPDVAVEIRAARPPARDIPVAALVDRQRSGQERDVEDERGECRRGEHPPGGALARVIRDTHEPTLVHRPGGHSSASVLAGRPADGPASPLMRFKHLQDAGPFPGRPDGAIAPRDLRHGAREAMPRR